MGGVKKVTGPETAGYAVANMRDLSELSFFKQEGEQWAWLSGFLFSSAETAKSCSGDLVKLSIGSRGYNEWLKIDRDAILSFTKPDGGRILAFDPEGNCKFDSIIDHGEVFAAAGSFITFVGNPADTFTVQVR